MKSLNCHFCFAIVVAVVAAGCARQAAPHQDSTVANDIVFTDLSPSAVIGRLGKPLGEREVIVGSFGGNIMLPNPLAISEVNGATLKPVMLEIRGYENDVKIEKGVTYRLEGYESGEFSGPPDWTDSGAQSRFQFRNFFEVTKIIGSKVQATPRHGPTVTNDIVFTDLKPSEVIGRLGKPLGEREVIVGSFVEPLMLDNPLAISEVNGATLKPVTLEIRGAVKIEKGVTYRLEGYESGMFSGDPSWTGPGIQQPFMFHNFFEVTKIIGTKVQSSHENR